MYKSEIADLLMRALKDAHFSLNEETGELTGPHGVGKLTEADLDQVAANMENEIAMKIADARDDGYDEGRDDVYHREDLAREEGRSEGYDEGYQEGYNAASGEAT
jgi:flagellar biosynthesis/type III secretory pathway protein FliH